VRHVVVVPELELVARMGEVGYCRRSCCHGVAGRVGRSRGWLLLGLLLNLR
jgi:hypothetical protein